MFAQWKIPPFSSIQFVFDYERHTYNIVKALHKLLENNLEFGINFVTLEQLLAKRSSPNQLQSKFWICCLIEQLPTFQRSLIFNGFDFSIGAFISNGHEIEFDPRVLDAELNASLFIDANRMASLSLSKGQWWKRTIYLKSDIRIKWRTNKHLSVEWFWMWR